MYPRAIVLVTLLLAAGSSDAAVRIDRKPGKNGACATPPAPPAPPVPPAPPPPPIDSGEAHAPIPPVPPAPPAPPAPPPLPAIPLTWTLGPGETMRGLCERVDGRMAFQLRSYRKAD